MFVVNENFQKWLCRGTFLSLCVVPTTCVLAWSVVRVLPGHEAALSRSWQRPLGLSVRVGRVEYPRPGLTQISRLEIADPESRGPLLTAAAADAYSGARRSMLRLGSVKANTAAVRQLFDALHAHWRRSDISPPELLIDELKITELDHSWQLRDVTVRFADKPDERSARFEFKLSARDEAAPIVLKLVRHRGVTESVSGSAPNTTDHGPRTTDSPHTRLELATGSTPIPLALVAAIAPPLEGLDHEGEFRGVAWASRIDGQWESDITGTLTGVDLSRWIGPRSSPRISGPVELTIRGAKIRNGRLTEAAGTLSAGPGQVQRELLLAAARQLQMRLPSEVMDPSSDPLPYRRLAVGFRLTGHRLELAGLAGNQSPRAVMIGHTGPLLSAPADAEGLSPLALVRLLSERSEVQVPATRRARAMLRWLPHASPVAK